MLEKFFGSSYEQIDDVPKEWDDDPVAQKTEWSPEKSGGTNFRTHRLERVGVTRMEFRLTLGAKLFCWLFIGMGVGIPLSIVSQEIRRPNTEFVSILFVAFIGIVFAGVGFGMQHFMGKPRVFDKACGRFWSSDLCRNSWRRRQRFGGCDNRTGRDADLHFLLDGYSGRGWNVDASQY